MTTIQQLLPLLLSELKAWQSLQKDNPLLGADIQSIKDTKNRLFEEIHTLEHRIEAIQSLIEDVDDDAEKMITAIRDEVGSIVKEKIENVEQLVSNAAKQSVEETQEKITVLVDDINDAIGYLTAFTDQTVALIEEKTAMLAQLADVDFDAIKESILAQMDLTLEFEKQQTDNIDAVKSALFQSVDQVTSNIEETINEVQATCQRLTELVNHISTSLNFASIGLTESTAAIDESKDAITSPL